MAPTRTIFALDFDGVLVDSAAETGRSGCLASKLLWPDWEAAKNISDDVIERFRQVRPCLETGWEASLIIRLLADSAFGLPTNGEILRDFQSTYKQRLLSELKLTPEQCNQALKTARNDWIARNNGQDWIQAHGFYDGACQAVRQLFATHGTDNVFIITTKAKDFALRLLEQKNLYSSSDPNGSSNTLPENHVYGLGSGPKATVLGQLLLEKSSSANDNEKPYVAVMVEDNLSTLHKIMATPELKGRVLPALASWGYNTTTQQEQAAKESFVVLDKDDSSSISRVLDPDTVLRHVAELQ